MQQPYRDDLMLAAYAQHLGFYIPPDRDYKFDQSGIPHESLSFQIGEIITDAGEAVPTFTVWQTARGWRCAQYLEDRWEPVQPQQFFQKLKDALDNAKERHTNRRVRRI